MTANTADILNKWERIIAYSILISTPLIVTSSTFDSYIMPKLIWLSLWGALWLCIFAFSKSAIFSTRSAVDLPVCAFLSVSFLCLLTGYQTPLQLRAYLHLVLFVGLFYAFRRFWMIYASTENVIRAMAFVSIIVSLYGILQDYGFDFAVKSGGVRDWRANVVATLGNPNFLAGYLGISLPPIIAYGLRQNASWRSYLLTLITVLSAFACIAVTFSVGVTTAFAGTGIIAILVLLLTRTRPQIPLFRFILLILAGTCSVSWYLLDNPFNSHGHSLYKEAMQSPQWWSGLGSREFNWGTTKIMIEDHPVLGIGFGNYLTRHIHYQGLHYSRLDDAHDREMVIPVDQPHFQMIETAAECGPFGVIAMLWIFTAWLRSAIRTLRQENSWFAWGSFLGVWIALIHSFSDFPFHLPASSLLVAVLASYHVKNGETEPALQTISPSLAKQSICVLAAIAIAVTALMEFKGSQFLKKGAESQGITAMAYLEEARFYDPYNFTTYVLLGNSYAGHQWYAKAADAWQKAIDLQEDMTCHKYLSQLYLRTGDQEKAIKEQRRVVELNPIFPGHLRNLANLLQKKELEAEVKQLEEKAQHLDAIIDKKYPHPAKPEK